MNVLFNHQNFDKKGRRVTFAGLINLQENSISIGVSTCSKKDQFSKKVGRVKAQGQAMSQKPLVVIQITSNHPEKDFYGAIAELSEKKVLLNA